MTEEQMNEKTMELAKRIFLGYYLCDGVARAEREELNHQWETIAMWNKVPFIRAAKSALTICDFKREPIDVLAIAMEQGYE